MIEEKKTWWFLFPLRGLDISDDQHDLENPIFGDFCIISRKHLKDLVQMFNSLTKIPPEKMEKETSDIVSLIKWVSSKEGFHSAKEDFHSFIAVKRTGIYVSGGKTSELEKISKIRAYQISALLTLVTLGENTEGNACGLIEQYFRQPKTTIAFSFEEGSFAVGGGQKYIGISTPYKPIVFSRDQLNQLINNAPYVYLANVLLTQNPSLPTSLSRTITQASIRLSDAIHGISLSSKLLGAVTSIEILLSNQPDKYNSLSNRLTSLLGFESYIKNVIDNVFFARHNYVHKGKEVEDIMLPLKAIGLALNCLLRYAEIASMFSNKEELIIYLDYLHSKDKLTNCWDKLHPTTSQIIQEHERNIFNFPFWNHISEKNHN